MSSFAFAICCMDFFRHPSFKFCLVERFLNASQRFLSFFATNLSPSYVFLWWLWFETADSNCGPTRPNFFSQRGAYQYWSMHGDLDEMALA